MLGLALALPSAATTAAALALGVGAIAMAAGIAAPIITYWISLIAGEHQGEDLDRWIEAVGSAAAGLLLSLGLSNAMFAIASALALAGMIIAAWSASGWHKHRDQLVFPQKSGVPPSNHPSAPSWLRNK
ncbi:hypothetical protein BBta_p0213 (plasmid) [Bradyrhizobium sp. BTAi1]|nr:hypothetical protein BBta_p0213 [Bradyrhizobium sp. BTAi1]